MLKKTLTLAVLLVITFIGNAQNFRINGIIVNSNDLAPVSYATIILQRVDSTFVQGTTSGDKGEFELTGVTSDNYHLLISCMGYETIGLVINNLTSHVDVGKVLVSEQTQTLNEVTVVANQVVSKIDRQIIFPSQAQIKISGTGYELINNMMLPGIKVNEKQNSISTIEGGFVQVRINDIKVEVPEVLALRPDEVIRVEYIDNPGVRYANEGAEAVINFVVRRKTAGVSVGVNLLNAVTTGYGDENLYVKANYRRSEFGLSYYLGFRDYTKRKIDATQSFLYPDDVYKEIRKEGVNTDFDYMSHDVTLSYNFTETDKYVFNVFLRGSFYDSPHRGYKQRIYEDNLLTSTSFSDPTDKSNKPSLDLYYQINLPKKQLLAFNVVGTYLSTDYYYRFREYDDKDVTLSSYEYATDGDRYSLIGEGFYEKEFKSLKLTSGVQYSQGYTRNIYSGDTEDTNRMHNSNIYLYAQLQGKWEKLNYMVGVGGNRNTFDQSKEGYNFYSFRPSLSLSYPIFKGATLRYNLIVAPNTPSLSNLSDVRQQISDREVNVGNPELEPYQSYTNQIRFFYQRPRFSTQFTGLYTYRNNPVMNQVRRVDTPEGSIFEYTLANQRNLEQLFGQLYAQYHIIQDVLLASAYIGVSHYISRGNDYTHYFTGCYGGGSIQFNWKDWSFSGVMNTRYKSLFGETINYQANYSSVDVKYRLKNFRFGAGVMFPFTSKGWSAGNKTLSNLAPQETWTYIKDNRNMVTLSFAWNFSHGRKYEGGRKTLNNTDNETGIVK